MTSFLRQSLFLGFLRGLWLVVAAVVACGGVHTPRMVAVAHSHPYQQGAAHTHRDYEDFLMAGKTGDPAPGQEGEKHTHRIPVQVDAPVIASGAAAAISTLPPAREPVVIAESDRGPWRPADPLIRPPRAA